MGSAAIGVIWGEGSPVTDGGGGSSLIYIGPLRGGEGEVGWCAAACAAAYWGTLLSRGVPQDLQVGRGICINPHLRHFAPLICDTSA